MMARSTRSTLSVALGVAAFGVALLLSAPGIRVARAGGAETAAAQAQPLFTLDPALVAKLAVDEPAPSCSLQGLEDRGGVLAAEAAMMRLQQAMRAQAAAAAQAPASSPDGIVLNGRGYNYPRTRPPKLAADL